MISVPRRRGTTEIAICVLYETAACYRTRVLVLVGMPTAKSLTHFLLPASGRKMSVSHAF